MENFSLPKVTLKQTKSVLSVCLAVLMVFSAFFAVPFSLNADAAVVNAPAWFTVEENTADEVVVNFMVENAAAMEAADLTFNYDGNVLEFSGYSYGDELLQILNNNEGIAAVNPENSGYIKAVLAFGENFGINSEAILFTFVFNRISNDAVTISAENSLSASIEIPAVEGDLPDEPTTAPGEEPSSAPEEETTQAPEEETTQPPEEPDYMPGDLDGNGKNEASDARIALRAVVGIESLNKAQQAAANVIKEVGDEDAINSMDARKILRASVGLDVISSTAPVEQYNDITSDYEGKLRLVPKEIEDNTIYVDVVADKLTDLKAYDINIGYDTAQLALEKCSTGDVFGKFTSHFLAMQEANAADDGNAEISGLFKEAFDYRADYSDDIDDYTAADEMVLCTLEFEIVPGVQTFELTLDGKMYVNDSDYVLLSGKAVAGEAEEETTQAPEETTQPPEETTTVPAGEMTAKLTVVENTEDTVKVQYVVENAAKLEAADYLFNYNSDVLKFKDYAFGEELQNALWRGDVITAINTENPGSIYAGLVFLDDFGINDESIIFIFTFERLKNESSVMTESRAGNISVTIPAGEGNAPEETTQPPEEPTTDVTSESCIEAIIDGTDIKLYFKNMVGLAVMDLVVRLDPAVVKSVIFEKGEDAKLVNRINFDNNQFTDEYNRSDVSCLYYACYFQEYLWSSEKFKEEALFDVNVNGEYFHFTTIKLALADGATAADIVAALEAEGRIISGSSSWYGDLTISVKNLNGEGNAPEETTQPPEETTTQAPEEITTQAPEETTTRPEDEMTTHGHDYSSEVTKAPTCVEAGVRTFRCACGNSYTESIPYLGGHKLTWSVTKEATSFEEGVKTGKCERCAYSEKIAIAKLPEIDVKADAEEFKVAESGAVVSLDEQNVTEMLASLPVGAAIVTEDNKAVASDALVATGMKVVLKDASGKIVDEKTIVVPGDVDCDGKITSADARNALRRAVGLDKVKDYQEAAADVDPDAKVTSSDARDILRMSVGLIEKKDVFKKVK